jgi:coiled-coil domain-containing protein 55
MPQLSYGLNIPKKAKSSIQKPQPAKRKALFGDDSDHEEEESNGPEAIQSLGQPLKRAPETTTKTGKSTTNEKRSQVDVRYGDLSARHNAAKHVASAQEVDPSVYDYDAVYDSLHAKPVKKKESAGPKYMQQLLESAEVRKRDQLRAKEKMLAKEREAEGDEFADKEKFVTAAYRAQQEEVKRLEEEERKKEEEAAERRKREGGGMRGLYKDMLARDDARQEAIAQALQDGAHETEQGDKGAEERRLAKEKGAVINEEGEVVDKRQLLKAGINVSAKPKTASQSAKTQSIASSNSMNVLRGRGEAKAAMRERQTRLIEEQLEQAAKRAADDEAAEQETIQKAAKSKKSEADISGARERYLQRKRDAEAAKVAGKEP